MLHILRILVFILNAGFSHVWAAECNPSAMVDGCTMDPDGMRLRLYAIALCSSEPSPPTSNSALDAENCEFIYNQIEAGGAVLEFNGSPNQFEQLTDNLIPPPDGTYTHAVVGLSHSFQIKKEMSFGSAMTGFGANHTQTIGTECWTTDEVRLNANGLRKVTTECAGVMGSSDWATNETYATGGIYLGCPAAQYWTDEDLFLAGNASEALVYLEISELAVPISITEATSYIEIHQVWENWLSNELDERSTTNSFHPHLNCGSSSITAN